MGTYNSHFNGIEVQSTRRLTDTNAVTLFCPVGPLRSPLMNIISVYRKQAFITSSRLEARQLNYTVLHTCAHQNCATLPRIFSCLQCPLLYASWGGHLFSFGVLLCNLFFFPSFILSSQSPLSLSKRSPFQNYYTWISAVALRVGLHLCPISAIKIHRHSPHGPANSVVHQLTYKPAFLKMYEKCILPNCNWDTGSLIVWFHQNCRGFMPKLSGS